MRKIDQLNERLGALEHVKMNPEVPFGWIDTADVLKMLKISLRTLQGYRDDGIIPFSRIGGKIFFLRSDIEAILEKNRVECY
ncbi:MAG: helix-turn-helix domain-containing protein [Bacteroidales bacterium]